MAISNSYVKLPEGILFGLWHLKCAAHLRIPSKVWGRSFKWAAAFWCASAAIMHLGAADLGMGYF